VVERPVVGRAVAEQAGRELAGRELAGRERAGPERAGPERRQPALANNAWEALLAAHATLMKQFAAEDIWSDVSMREYDVLYTLSKCPEPMRLGELNRHVLLSQPALSRMVDRLAGRGLVKRTADPDDRRGLQLSLTRTGQEVQREIGRQHARGVAGIVTARLTSEQIRQLEAICLRLAGGQGPAAPDANIVKESNR
jgi:DNA-binding MarR family transcriptional regulator